MKTGLPEAIFQQYNVSRESRAELEAYVGLLQSWQRRINLVGPATVDKIWTRHILDAFQLIPYLPSPCRAISDLGSGAGIPGLVLALATNSIVHLYESNGKKVAFLREVIRRTGAAAIVHPVRLETLSGTADLPEVDCVTSRALAPLPLLLDYAEPFLKQGTVGLFHKGQDLDLELTKAAKYWRLNIQKHQSSCDSRGVILEVKEAVRV